MNYKFSNLLGAPYRGGNLLLHGESELLTPVGNRVSLIDLQNSETLTLPVENSCNISRIALSPNGVLLLSVDEEGRALLINVRRKVVLHHFSFKEPVSVIKFSPDGKYFAAGVGKFVQVWHTPGITKVFTPFQLHKTYAACHDKVVSLAWSQDQRWIVAGSKDLTARIFSFHALTAFKPVTLSGHRESVVGVFFRARAPSDGPDSYGVYTIGKDGALFVWQFQAEAAPGASAEQKQKEVLNAGAGQAASVGGVRVDQGKWQLSQKHYFMQPQSKVTACAYHQGLNLLVAGFSTGVFGLYQLPDFSTIHLLSISKERISSVDFNTSGDWLAFGCAKLGQLLVWEWRSETYVLKQQGHYFDVNTLAFSPSGTLLATGADDNKLKVWNVASGFCFVTMAEHTMPITGVQFLPNGNAVLSSSLDGTVRAFDLIRYRNFRTFTSPTPTQLAALAIHPSGDIVCAASLDNFQIYVWSVKTGRLLDILSGHEGPVHSLAFSPMQELLASASWDRTVRIWDVFEGKGGVEPLQHTHEVLAVAYRPDGRQLACATLDGQIYLWDPVEGELQGTIEGRRDIAGGRLMGDRQTAVNSSGGKCFNSLAYSPDGGFLLAAGSSKYICCYDLAEKVLLRRFEVSCNRSMDGILDILNSKRMTDAGPLDLLDLEQSDDEMSLKQVSGGVAMGLPGAVQNRGRPVVKTKSLQLSPTGQCWAAATTAGILMYSLDEGLVFDPSDLDVDVTPQAVAEALAAGKFTMALLMALRLNEPSLIRQAVESVPPAGITSVVQAIPRARLPALVASLAHYLEHSPHVEFLLHWCQEIFVVHGRSLQRHGVQPLLPSLRALNKGLASIHDDLAKTSSSNLYLLKYLSTVKADQSKPAEGGTDDLKLESKAARPTKKIKAR